LKKAYRKIHQDAQISRFLQRFPELKYRKEQLGSVDAIVSDAHFGLSCEGNPFRYEMRKSVE